MFKLMTIALLSSTIALGPFVATSEIVEDRQAITTENVKRATYDDNDYTITLLAYEINNYNFDNLNGYFVNNSVYNIGSYIPSFTYNGATYSYAYGTINADLTYAYATYKYSDNYYISFNHNLGPGPRFGNVFYKNTYGNGSYDSTPFAYDLTLNLKPSTYNLIKGLMLTDIEDNENRVSNITLFDSIYDYFDNNVFDSEYLNDYEMEIMGHTTTMRHYLCLTGTIIFITLIVIFCVGFIVMLVKFVANMLINLGR